MTLRTIGLILGKDLLVELRTREVVVTMSLFALLVVVIFAFAFDADPATAQVIAPGLLWVTLLFAGTLGIARVFDRERDHGCLAGLLASPGGPAAVFVAKALGVLIFMVLMEILIVPLALLFVGIEIPVDGIGTVVLALLLGSIGFALIGTLFGAMLAQARLREVLVPLVVYPVVVPVLIGGVELTAIALGAGVSEDGGNWLGLMAGFDLIFAALTPWVFGRVMVE